MEEKRKRILIVDRSDEMRSMLAETLDAAGYDVVEACNGLDALEKNSRHPADMIISDLDAGEISGIELFHRIRARKGERFVPIIMLSVEDTVRMRREGTAAGVSGWLVKPFRPESVLSVVKLIS